MRIVPLLLMLPMFDYPQERPGVEWDTSRIAGFFARANVRGCIALYDIARDRWYRYNPARCDSEFLPASTFKIFNALVGLETGVIRDAAHLRRWDGVHRPVEEWNRDHTMQSAMNYSVVWYFQDVAREIGEIRMREYLSRLGYGNGDISAGIDTFWLTGKFGISANGQVQFLKRLSLGDLPFSPRTMSIVKSVLVNDSSAGYVLRAKTGLTRVSPGRLIGWWVGEVENDQQGYVFAANLEGDADDPGIRTLCREITLKILDSAGLGRK